MREAVHDREKLKPVRLQITPSSFSVSHLDRSIIINILTTASFADNADQKPQGGKPMKDLDALFKAVADGLEAMAEGIHAIAKKVDDLAKGEAPEKPAKAKPATKRKAGNSLEKGTKENQT